MCSLGNERVLRRAIILDSILHSISLRPKQGKNTNKNKYEWRSRTQYVLFEWHRRIDARTQTRTHGDWSASLVNMHAQRNGRDVIVQLGLSKIFYTHNQLYYAYSSVWYGGRRETNLGNMCCCATQPLTLYGDVNVQIKTVFRLIL